MNYEDTLVDLIQHLCTVYETVDDIETKLLEDLKEEIERVQYERATTIDTLADMWDDSHDSTED